MSHQDDMRRDAAAYEAAYPDQAARHIAADAEDRLADDVHDRNVDDARTRGRIACRACGSTDLLYTSHYWRRCRDCHKETFVAD